MWKQKKRDLKKTKKKRFFREVRLTYVQGFCPEPTVIGTCELRAPSQLLGGVRMEDNGVSRVRSWDMLSPQRMQRTGVSFNLLGRKPRSQMKMGNRWRGAILVRGRGATILPIIWWARLGLFFAIKVVKQTDQGGRGGGRTIPLQSYDEGLLRRWACDRVGIKGIKCCPRAFRLKRIDRWLGSVGR